MEYLYKGNVTLIDPLIRPHLAGKLRVISYEWGTIKYNCPWETNNLLDMFPGRIAIE